LSLFPTRLTAFARSPLGLRPAVRLRSDAGGLAEATRPGALRAFPSAPSQAIRPGEGVNDNMAKPTFKVGIVTVQAGRTPTRGQPFWQLRYIDPKTGKEVKRRVAGLDRDEIADMAKNLTRRAYRGKGYLAGQAPSLEEGLVEAVRLSRGNLETKCHANQKARLFLAYMGKRYGSVKRWNDLRPGMLESYVRELEGRGLAWDTVRNRIGIVRSAWLRMHADYPEDVGPLPRIRQAPRARREIQCLDAPDVGALLDWLKEHRPGLWGMGCLQALAGLRGREAAALRIQDVDFEAFTVTVTTTPLHAVKTAASERTLPVCREIMEALRATATGQQLRPVSGELFADSKGDPWRQYPMSGAWTKALRQASLDLDRPHLATVPGRKLRASFATMAGQLAVSDRALKAYMGHVPGDILGGHYQRVTSDQLASVSEAMETWRETLVEAPRRKESGNIRRAVLVND